MKGLRLHEDAPIEEIRGATRRATSALVDLALEEQIDILVQLACRKATTMQCDFKTIMKNGFGPGS